MSAGRSAPHGSRESTHPEPGTSLGFCCGRFAVDGPSRVGFASPMRSLVLLMSALCISATASAQPTERRRVVRTHRGGPSLAVTGEVLTRALPKSVALSPDASHLWVCNFGRIDGESVFVYDSTSLEHVGTVEFEGNAVETTFSPDGAFAYVTNFRRGMVEVIDTTTYEVVREVRVGANPKTMVASPDGERLYVALYTQRRVAVLNTSTWQVDRLLITGRQPRGMVMMEGNLYVASFRSDFVQVFDAEGEEQARFDTCAFPRHLELGGEGQLLVSCTLNAVHSYDALTGALRMVARTGRNPRTLAVSEDGRWAVTANFAEGDITLVDLENLTHRTSEVENASRLVGIAILPSEDGSFRVFATSWDNRRLYVLSPE